MEAVNSTLRAQYGAVRSTTQYDAEHELGQYDAAEHELGSTTGAGLSLGGKCTVY